MSVPQSCRVSNCNRKVRCKNLCDTHYERHRKGLSVDDYEIAARSKQPKNCLIQGCLKTPRTRGLCTTHQSRKNRGDDLFAPLPVAYYGCSVPGCSKPHKANRLCKSHYRTYLAFGLTLEELILRDTGYCSICGDRNESGRPLHVDHDHKCCPAGSGCRNCIRGFLCSRCNTGLGMFRDSTTFLESAIKYLGEPPGVSM